MKKIAALAAPVLVLGLAACSTSEHSNPNQATTPRSSSANSPSPRSAGASISPKPAPTTTSPSTNSPASSSFPSPVPPNKVPFGRAPYATKMKWPTVDAFMKEEGSGTGKDSAWCAVPKRLAQVGNPSQMRSCDDLEHLANFFVFNDSRLGNAWLEAEKVELGSRGGGTVLWDVSEGWMIAANAKQSALDEDHKAFGGTFVDVPPSS